MCLILQLCLASHFYGWNRAAEQRTRLFSRLILGCFEWVPTLSCLQLVWRGQHLCLQGSLSLSCFVSCRRSDCGIQLERCCIGDWGPFSHCRGLGCSYAASRLCLSAGWPVCHRARASVYVCVCVCMCVCVCVGLSVIARAQVCVWVCARVCK